jgi:hypothetical protein
VDAQIRGLEVLAQEEAERFRQLRKAKTDGGGGGGESSDDEVGPMPAAQAKEYGLDKKLNYGAALMPGEGDAIAQFVQQNLRIPRRGEIGWQAEDIERLETDGYVMSGSRHTRMNAVRIRKENQVYSAEEKRALALITFEEKQQREQKIVGDFRTVLQQQLQSMDKSGAPHSTE